jgi:hypothetical protein
MSEPTRKQLIARWENALRVLETMTPHERRKHFNMARWGQKTECGTVACLAGHCSLDPWFRRRGFRGSFIDDGGMYFGADSADPDVFFGTGSAIFYQSGSYGVVANRVRRHIKQLRVE